MLELLLLLLHCCFAALLHCCITAAGAHENALINAMLRLVCGGGQASSLSAWSRSNHRQALPPRAPRCAEGSAKNCFGGAASATMSFPGNDQVCQTMQLTMRRGA